jgi:Protein of unknown function (DUF4089)
MKRKAKRTAKRAKRAAMTAAMGKARQKSTAKLKTSGATKSVTRSSAKKRSAKKIASPDAVDVLVEAGAKALGLPLDPAWHAGVKFNLQLILRHAALVDEFALPDDAEPAPVYHA